MTSPHYISEDKSDMRDIKHGGYAMEEDGNLYFWAFFKSRGMHQENHSTDERPERWRPNCKKRRTERLDLSTSDVEGRRREV
jgi:hypothetical protein